MLFYLELAEKKKEAVGDCLYDFYCVKGERGEVKKIKLDREMVKGFENIDTILKSV